MSEAPLHDVSPAESPDHEAQRRAIAVRARNKRLMFYVWAFMHALMNLAWVLSRVHHFQNPSWEYALGDFANLCAFNGLVFFTLMLLLGSRNPLLERTFGLDRMMLLHRRLGVATVACFVGHAIFRTWSISLNRGVGYDFSLLYSMDLAEWDLVLGRLALVILLVGSALAFLGQKYLLIRYQHWKRPHYLFYLSLPMGLVHAYAHGNDMGTHPFLEAGAALAAVAAADFLRRVWYLLRRKRRQIWTLVKRDQVTGDTTTLTLEHPDAPANFRSMRAGQFGVTRCPHAFHLNEPHPFTVVSAPPTAPTSTYGALQFSIKVAGDFTTEFVRLPVGTEVLVEGPYGVFLSDVARHERLGLIAGGVGVTPFLSLIRDFAAREVVVPTTLVWSNKTLADAFAVEELVGYTNVIPLKLVFLFTRESPEAFPSEHHAVTVYQGRLGPGLVGEIFRGDEGFYVCGPESMQVATVKALQTSLGVEEKRITREHFFW